MNFFPRWMTFFRGRTSSSFLLSSLPSSGRSSCCYHDYVVVGRSIPVLHPSYCYTYQGLLPPPSHAPLPCLVRTTASSLSSLLIHLRSVVCHTRHFSSKNNHLPPLLQLGKRSTSSPSSLSHPIDSWSQSTTPTSSSAVRQQQEGKHQHQQDQLSLEGLSPLASVVFRNGARCGSGHHSCSRLTREEEERKEDKAGRYDQQQKRPYKHQEKRRKLLLSRGVMSLSLDSPSRHVPTDSHHPHHQSHQHTHQQQTQYHSQSGNSHNGNHILFNQKAHRSKLPGHNNNHHNFLLCHGLRFICCSSIKWNTFVNEFSYRTHNCGQLRHTDHGKDVVLCGWIQYNRGGRFLVLRDSYGITQLVVPEAAVNPVLTSKSIAKIPLESVIVVKGIVRRRPHGQENKNLPTGEIEVILSDLKVMSEAGDRLPFQIRSHNKPKETIRLKYRYLDLRMREMQYNLRLRSQFVSKVRDFLNTYGFIEVETPTLFKQTPGGAQEFVVPSREKGKYFSLVQSPQQLKQLLMIGGIDRYYQIARCYRDEGTKDDRQPEFTQIDLELSFVRRKDITNLIEQLLLSSWPPVAGKIHTPFPRITFSEAMKLYGTDKPDLRFDMRIHDLTNLLDSSDGEVLTPKFRQGWKCKGIGVSNGSKLLKDDLSRLRKEFQKFCKETSFDGKLVGLETSEDLDGNDKWNRLHVETRSQILMSLGLTEGDYLWLAIGEDDTSTCKLLGKVRVEVARTLDTNGYAIYNRDMDPCFLWVHDFPLFLPSDEDSSRLESSHHPFTAPRETDRELLFSDPSRVIGEHFDLVLNGEEVGGGSIRINDPVLQKHVLKNILQIEDIEEKMGYFFEALESGCPPHGGIALGLDRLVYFMCPSATSIRDVIAFPKSADFHDLMTGAPCHADSKTKALYHLNRTHAGASCTSPPPPPPAPPVTARSSSSSSSSPTLPSPPSSLIREPESPHHESSSYCHQTEVKTREDND